MHSAHDAKTDVKEVTSLIVSLPLPAPPAQSKQSRWLPPALRAHGSDGSRKPHETPVNYHPEPPRTFAFSQAEPPMSPPPSDDNYSIRMGKCGHAFKPVPRKKLQSFEKFYGPVRWEILSFEPPVEGMSKWALSVNDVLFRRPPGFKGRRFIVSLPKTSRVPLPLYATDMITRSDSYNSRKVPRNFP